MVRTRSMLNPNAQPPPAQMGRTRMMSNPGLNPGLNPNAQPRMAQPPGRPRQLGGGPSQINTSIQPTGVYPQQHTQRMSNLASAMGVPARADLLNANSFTGSSIAGGISQQGIGVDYGNAMAQALMAPQQVGMQHGIANQRNIMQGQMGREQEAMGWDRLRQGQQNSLLSALGNYF